ncbi:MAG: DUF819 family protein [Deltaproteobacteria bacterium]|nr:DUF819 family protein [Deltaproteobacteria bacterium]
MEPELLLLVILIVSVLCLSLERKIAWFLHINGICLIILCGVLLAALGFVPHQHALYDFFSGTLVPLAIALLIMSLDIRLLTKLPRKFLAIYAIGIVASMSGALVAALIFRDLGLDAAKLAAQLGASYIGGGENAVAMQKIFNIPLPLFVGTFAVDNVLTSLWMLLMIFFIGPYRVQSEFVGVIEKPPPPMFTIIEILSLIFCAIGVVWIAQFLSTRIGLLHTLLYVSLLSILAGQMGWVRRLSQSAYLLGVLLFLPFFFAIGAHSDFAAIARLPAAVLAMPPIVVGVHGLIMVICGKFLRIPRHYLAVASQSLIGGPSTAVAVAQAREWHEGVPIAVIAGVGGYAIANFIGVLIYRLAAAMCT